MKKIQLHIFSLKLNFFLTLRLGGLKFALSTKQIPAVYYDFIKVKTTTS